MREPRLNFAKRKFILKFYWQNENVVQVQINYHREIQSEPPTCFTINLIKFKLDRNGCLKYS